MHLWNKFEYAKIKSIHIYIYKGNNYDRIVFESHRLFNISCYVELHPVCPSKHLKVLLFDIINVFEWKCFVCLP